MNKSVSHRPAATGYTGPAATREHAKVVTAPQAMIENREGGDVGGLRTIGQALDGLVVVDSTVGYAGELERIVQNSGHYPEEAAGS